ncbi:MAG TPA: hypothetical protein VJ203_09465 [Bacteroidales bacterium]|nr:hypothetical protein [Bacteroidales bacterium]
MPAVVLPAGRQVWQMRASLAEVLTKAGVLAEALPAGRFGEGLLTPEIVHEF